jgi:UDP-glucose 4-epimerase
VRQRIMVTGVAGFVGSNLAKKLLEKDYAVVGIDDLSAGTIENVDPRVDFHQADIRSQQIYSLFEGADGVFHLAAKTSLVDCLAKPLEAADMNVSGTLNVLEAARKANVRKFIYADTSAEYEGIHEFPTPEERIRPIGVYAASKHGGATFCESYRRLYNMNVAMVRYFNVYGPAQDWRRVIPPVMSSFIIRMLQGESPLIYGTGEKRRDFIYVDDVNDLHLVILQNDRSDGRVFNIGSGVNHSVNEIYRLLESLLKTGLKPIYKPDLPGEAEITLADITSAKSLGWKPRIDIEEGLKRTIDYLQSRVLNVNASLTGGRAN